MEPAIALLTVPGNILLNLFLDADGPKELILRESMAPWLGAVFWLTLLLAFRLARPIARALRLSPRVPGMQGRRRAPTWRGYRDFRARDGWAAIWRAQVVHLALYLGLPLLWEAGRGALIAVFLPILIIGFGDRHIARTDGTLDHLRTPACWTFVGLCPGPRSHFLEDPVMDLSQCVRDACPPGQSKVPDFGGWGWKVLWLAISMGWLSWWWRFRRATAA
jgi:hypothetical protein